MSILITYKGFKLLSTATKIYNIYILWLQVEIKILLPYIGKFLLSGK